MIPRLTARPAVIPLYERFMLKLQRRGFEGDCSSRIGERVALSTDSSIYHRLPQAVIFPKCVDDIVKTATLAAEPRFRDLKLAPRGGGTGTNGQSLTDGVVVDLSRHMNGIIEINPEERWARVQPGVVKDRLMPESHAAHSRKIAVAEERTAASEPDGRNVRTMPSSSGGLARTSVALFFAGFATFSLIYCTQPLLPEFSVDFGVDPATSSLALSLTTGCLAISMLCVGALSETWGRRGLMFFSMSGAAILNLVSASAPNWELLLVIRSLEGMVLGGVPGGVPAVAMAYLSEEIPAERLSWAMGLYVGGTALGGIGASRSELSRICRRGA
jgi:hypothetical protein